jgi:hypothetical protein
MADQTVADVVPEVSEISTTEVRAAIREPRLHLRVVPGRRPSTAELPGKLVTTEPLKAPSLR